MDRIFPVPTGHQVSDLVKIVIQPSLNGFYVSTFGRVSFKVIKAEFWYKLRIRLFTDVDQWSQLARMKVFYLMLTRAAR